MFAKLEITGNIEVVTGMHIGGSSQFAAIGAVDSPVIRDTYSDRPMIPGSSLKGKMRSLLAKKYNEKGINTKHDDDADEVIRLFGSAKKNDIRKSRLIFSDTYLSNMDKLKELGLHSATEVKLENTINRLTAVANPRQIERTIRGSEFNLSMIYDADKEEDIIEDFKTIAEGLKLLTYDYLGGHGSRGYGKIKFNDLNVYLAVGEVSDKILEECNNILKEG